MAKPNPHPYVTLRRRGSGWSARWTDPVSQHRREVSLTRLGVTTAEGRRSWAERQSAVIATARARSLGAVSALAVEDAVAAYMAELHSRLEAPTVRTYGPPLRSLRDWLGAAGVRLTHEIHPPHLARWRQHMLAQAKAPATTNLYLRRVRTALRAWVRMGLCPELNYDTVKDRLSGVTEPRDQPDYLSRDQLRELLLAVVQHDQIHRPALPLVAGGLLSGCRGKEWRLLRWDRVDLDQDCLRLRAEDVKTRQARLVDLRVSPALRRLLAGLPRRGEFVLPAYSNPDSYERLKVDLRERYGAPRWGFRLLRHTCASYLTNAPGIFGTASAFRSAAQLGHSVAVAERHYVGVIRDIPHDARTLEAAMGIEAMLEEIIPGMTPSPNTPNPNLNNAPFPQPRAVGGSR